MKDIDNAKEVVENFISEMNLWEKYSEELDDKEDGLSWEQKEDLITPKSDYCNQ